MIQINGTARLARPIDNETLAAFTAMVTASRAEAGCLHYSYARDLVDDEVMIILERWRDQAAVEFHFATPHMAAFRAFLAQSGAVAAMDVCVYESDEGSPLRL